MLRSSIGKATPEMSKKPMGNPAMGMNTTDMTGMYMAPVEVGMKKGGMAKKPVAYNKGGYVNCGASVPATQKGKK